MNLKIFGEICLIEINGQKFPAKIIKVEEQVGFEDHGELFVTAIIQDGSVPWNEAEKRLHISEVELINKE